MIQWMCLKCTRARQETHVGKALSSSQMPSNETMTCAVWAVWEQNDHLWSQCCTDHSVYRMTNSKVHRAMVLPGGACSLGSHLLFPPISGARQRLLHTASHTYAKYCWTPTSREQNSVETDRGKRWDVPHLTNNHFYDHLCNTWLSPYSSTELYDESCNRLLQVTAEGPHHFWNSMRAASSSSAAVYVSDVEAGTVAITHIPSYASQGQHWKVTWDVTSPITKGAVGQLRSQHHHMLISWLQSPPTLSSEVSRTDFGALGYKWRIPGEADRIRYKIAKNLWCRLKANPFQPQPFCEIFYTGSFGDLSNPPPRGTWKAGRKYQSCIPEVNITIPLGTYTPRPADISASLISRVST